MTRVVPRKWKRREDGESRLQMTPVKGHDARWTMKFV
jgi:hypothetical protein